MCVQADECDKHVHITPPPVKIWKCHPSPKVPKVSSAVHPIPAPGVHMHPHCPLPSNRQPFCSDSIELKGYLAPPRCRAKGSVGLQVSSSNDKSAPWRKGSGDHFQ